MSDISSHPYIFLDPLPFRWSCTKLPNLESKRIKGSKSDCLRPVVEYIRMMVEKINGDVETECDWERGEKEDPSLSPSSSFYSFVTPIYGHDRSEERETQ